MHYVTDIEDFLDIHKAYNITDNTLQCFAVTKAYLPHTKLNIIKKKNFECNGNLDLETFISEDIWTTIDEIEEVIPFHLSSFR